ncbi:hypothetical protein B0H13DRAFT_1645300 [Mycena leptocephala]|nr:hypothetical protein B0H13DRAFT_1645300 [Mycena leptocephala]
MIHLVVGLYASPLYWKQDYHTSALSGQAWVDELIVGHPNRIKCELKAVRVDRFSTDSDVDSDVDSGTDSQTRIGLDQESVKIGVPPPEEELHQNRSRISPESMAALNSLQNARHPEIQIQIQSPLS